jgi:hypothetical protein
MAKTSASLDGATQVSQQFGPQKSSEHLEAFPQQNKGDTEKSITHDGSADKRGYPTGIKRALILGPVTLTYFLFFLDLAVVSTATPAITSQFNSLVDVGWYDALEKSPTNLVLLTIAC